MTLKKKKIVLFAIVFLFILSLCAMLGADKPAPVHAAEQGRFQTLDLENQTADASYDAQGWSWTAANKTLTLNNASFTIPESSFSNDNRFAVVLPGDATVYVPAGTTSTLRVSGKRSGAPPNSHNRATAGVYANGNLLITGGGTLNLVGADWDNMENGGCSNGISLPYWGSLTVDGTTLNATAGKTISPNTFNTLALSSGIQVGQGLYVRGGASVTGTGNDTNSHSAGIDAGSIVISNGTLRGISSTVNSDPYRPAYSGAFSYDFAGVYKKAVAEGNELTPISGTAGTGKDVTYQYNSGLYICYDSNGATGGHAPETADYESGDTVTVAGNTGGMEKTVFYVNYTFNGWNTKADGSGTAYAAGDNFNIAANTVLYAQWLAHSHTYSSEWTSNATDHWHAATCEHTTLRSDQAAHTFGAWETVTQATCDTAGSRKHSCTVCAYEETETVAATGHAYSASWSSDAARHWHAATCEHTGLKSGEAAHTFGPWTTVTQATCTTAGSRESSCSVCSYKRTEAVPATGHNAASAWTSDSAGHWHTCRNSPSEKLDPAAHTFGPWTNGTNGGMITSESVCSVCAYRQIRYPLAFHANGGNGSMDGMTFELNIPQNLTANSFTRTGYIFQGWSISKALADAGVISSQDGAFYTMSIGSTQTLYAAWAAKKYDVILDANNGSGLTAPFSMDFVSTAQLPAISELGFNKTGYSFAGWATSAMGAVKYADNASYTMQTEGATLYAIWHKEVVYREVTFRTNGGSTVASIQVLNGNRLPILPTPTKTGFAFTGWFADSACTVKVDTSAPVTANMTLYAGWTGDTVTVIFMNGSVKIAEIGDVQKGGYVPQIDNPAETGKVFVGWFTDSAFTNRFSFLNKVNENLTLYAKFTSEEFEVIFETNGGSAVDKQSGIPYNGKITPPANPTKSGYAFAGWFADEPLTEAFSFQYTPVTQNLILYAKWTPDSFSITGKVVSENGTAIMGAVVSLALGDVLTQITGPGGTFTFTDIPSGIYFLIVTCTVDGSQRETCVMAKVEGVNCDMGDIVIYSARLNTGVEIEDGSPEAAIGGLDRIFSSNCYDDGDKNVTASGGSMFIKFYLGKRDLDETNNGGEIIRFAGAGKEIGAFLDLSVMKILKDADERLLSQSYVLELEDTLEIVIPLERVLQGKANYVIYRSHNNVMQAITLTPNAEGEYLEISADGTYLTLHVNKFSEYAIGFDATVSPAVKISECGIHFVIFLAILAFLAFIIVWYFLFQQKRMGFLSFLVCLAYGVFNVIFSFLCGCALCGIAIVISWLLFVLGTLLFVFGKKAEKKLIEHSEKKNPEKAQWKKANKMEKQKSASAKFAEKQRTEIEKQAANASETASETYAEAQPIKLGDAFKKIAALPAAVGYKASKAGIADYLESNYKDVEINRRDNFISTGLPLADTHYAKKGVMKVAGKEIGKRMPVCFTYVYELGEGKVMMLARLDQDTADELRDAHKAVYESAYPKSGRWYSIIVDDSFTEESQVFKILDKAKVFVETSEKELPKDQPDAPKE